MMRRSITVPDDLDRSILDLRAFVMKMLGMDLDYTHALIFLAKLGFEELTQTEFGPQSMELLEKELSLDSSLKESLQGDWKKWRAVSAGEERLPIVDPNRGRRAEATRAGKVSRLGHIIIGFCIKCRAKREMKDAQMAVFGNGARGYTGICPICRSKMIKFGI